MCEVKGSERYGIGTKGKPGGAPAASTCEARLLSVKVVSSCSFFLDAAPVYKGERPAVVTLLRSGARQGDGAGARAHAVAHLHAFPAWPRRLRRRAPRPSAS